MHTISVLHSPAHGTPKQQCFFAVNPISKAVSQPELTIIVHIPVPADSRAVTCTMGHLRWLTAFYSFACTSCSAGTSNLEGSRDLPHE